MNTLEAESPPVGSTSASGSTATAVRPAGSIGGKGASIFRKLLFLLVAGGAVGAGYYYLTEGGKKPLDAERRESMLSAGFEVHSRQGPRRPCLVPEKSRSGPPGMDWSRSPPTRKRQSGWRSCR